MLWISAALADAPGWRTETLIRDAASLAAHIDFGNGEALARALGVRVPLRPYCTRTVCDRSSLIGYADSFPDPPLRLPGPEGLTAQIYVASVRPRTGTLAALDIFLPPREPCLTRAAVRSELGPESFKGTLLGLDEPAEATLDYLVQKKPGFHTVLEFVFAGPPFGDGCLAFVSIRDDTFGLAPTPADDRLNAWSVVNDNLRDEDPVDDGRPADLLTPGVDLSPLGLTKNAFLARYPVCQLGPARPVEQFAPLTGMAPPAMPLLPVAAGAYLATEHSIWSTLEHGESPAPALDATLVTQAEATCAVANPLSQSIVYRTDYQHYRVLLFDGRVLAVKVPSRQRTAFTPAGIEAMRLLAQVRGDVSRLAPSPTHAPATIHDASSVFGVAVTGGYDVLVQAVGPAPVFGADSARSSQRSEVFIDKDLWDAYARRVKATLSGLQHGVPATAVAAPVHPSSAPAAAAMARVTSKQFLAALQTFFAAADLSDTGAFARAMGGKAVLLGDDTIVRRIGDGSATVYTVGLMPGPTLLDGLGFKYQIFPLDQPDPLHRLPPYHRLLDQIDIADVSRTLDRRFCITRHDLLAAFGADQMTDFRQKSTYVHKFAGKSSAADTIFASFSFNTPYPGAMEPPDNSCVSYISLSQYRYVPP